MWQFDSPFRTMNTTLLLGDCLERLKELPDNSVDSIVTDPPYGLGKEPDALKMLTDWIETGHHDVKGRGFMGKEWDAFVPQPQVWHECLRVLKPGGHLLAFAGTRTQDLMTLGLRLAGFEIRDMVAWGYGSGFPKSLDVSKALDKMAGAEREVVGRADRIAGNKSVGTIGHSRCVPDITAPATDAAKQWNGWGTALKPALEPITLARKPLEGTVAANVLKWHTGALNIDGCRVATDDKLGGGMENGTSKVSEGWDRPWRTDEEAIERNKKATCFHRSALREMLCKLVHS
jgi:site-specific DNA-methyltransferase (adenine-specific)